MTKVKKLYRSKTERHVAGVCGGIADYFVVDPTLIRLVWVLLTVLTGGALLIGYLLAWLVVPEQP